MGKLKSDSEMRKETEKWKEGGKPANGKLKVGGWMDLTIIISVATQRKT